MILKFGLLAGVAIAIAGTQPAAAACKGPACGGTLVYIGTHGSGPGQGIFAARLDPKTGALTSLGLAAEIERPTWIERDPTRAILYSVSEVGNSGDRQGSVYSLSIDRGAGTLRTIARSDSGGGGATNLTYGARARALFVANYGGGQVAAIPVGPNGGLTRAGSVQTNVGSGPHARQKGPHAHGVTVAPGGSYVLSPDLGADRVFVYRYDAAKKMLSPAAVPSITFPPGSGPRHLIFSRDGRFAFVDTELTGEIFSFRWDGRAASLTQTARTAIDAPDFTGTKSAAEIATSRDGRFLYVSNRGANLMQVFSIDRATGALSEIQRIDCGGQVPWSFAIDPSGGWLIVTNEASSNLAVFAVDRTTGRLTATRNALSVPKPVAVAFVE